MWQARKRFFFAQNAWFFPDALKFENNISWKAWKRKSFGTITDLLIPKKNFIFLLDKTFFFRWPGLRPYGPPKKKFGPTKKKSFFGSTVRNCSKASFFSNYSRPLWSPIFIKNISPKICDRKVTEFCSKKKKQKVKKIKNKS